MHVKSSEAKRRLVLEVSADVFRNQGYTRTTMGDLAKAAGMSRPALYLVFPRKEQLFSTLIRAEEAGESVLSDPGAAPVSRGYRELVEWLLWACDLWTGHGARCSASTSDGRHPQEKFSEYGLIENLLREGIEGRLPLCDSGPATADVARLIATCMRGLSEIPLEDAERRRLMTLQVEAIARAAGWAGHADHDRDGRRQPTLM